VSVLEFGEFVIATHFFCGLMEPNARNGVRFRPYGKKCRKARGMSPATSGLIER